MQEQGARIYNRYGLWYVSFAGRTPVAPIHVTGPFQTQTQAEQIVHMGAFAQKVVH
jgi:hypothetical protein